MEDTEDTGDTYTQTHPTNFPLETQINIANQGSITAQDSINFLRRRQQANQQRMGNMSLQQALEIRDDRPLFFRQILNNQLAYEADGREVRRMERTREQFRLIENRLAGIYRDNTSEQISEGNTTAVIGQE